ncbi:MAG TPA: cupredoxin domain-containing protein [Candidatus Thermoplasmatota archaeon]|nr:cupredoxin domain-containing protein [Candidatus Thermoplasmatota archaeon]
MSTQKIGFTVLVAALTLFAVTALATPAAAQTTGRVIEIWADDEGVSGDWWFTLPNSTEKNPTLTVNASETVTFRLINKGEAQHNLHIMGTGAANKATAILGPGQEANLTVTFPANAGTIKYQCDPHAGVMEGTITVQAAQGGNQNTGGNQNQNTPAFEALLALGAVAGAAFLLSRRKA